jgi:predicted transcriptional regulator
MFEEHLLENSKPDALGPIMEMTVQLVSAYVQKNSVPISEFPVLIETVHTKLKSLSGLTVEEPAPAPEKLKPAVPVKKSITPEYLVSLEDGKHYRTLKRHLSKLGLTPSEYREKWGLPYDYPMVARSYAAKRSELAKSMGLGRKANADEVAPEPEPEPAPEPKKRGRKPKATE